MEDNTQTTATDEVTIEGSTPEVAEETAEAKTQREAAEQAAAAAETTPEASV